MFIHIKMRQERWARIHLCADSLVIPNCHVCVCRDNLSSYNPNKYSFYMFIHIQIFLLHVYPYQKETGEMSTHPSLCRQSCDTKLPCLCVQRQSVGDLWNHLTPMPQGSVPLVWGGWVNKTVDKAAIEREGLQLAFVGAEYHKGYIINLINLPG